MIEILSSIYKYFYEIFNNLNIKQLVVDNAYVWLTASMSIMIALPFVGIIKKWLL